MVSHSETSSRDLKPGLVQWRSVTFRDPTANGPWTDVTDLWHGVEKPVWWHRLLPFGMACCKTHEVERRVFGHSQCRNVGAFSWYAVGWGKVRCCQCGAFTDRPESGG